MRIHGRGRGGLSGSFGGGEGGAGICGIFGYIRADPAASILPVVRFDGPGVGPGTHRDLGSRTTFPWRGVPGMVSPPLSSAEDSKSDGEVANERFWIDSHSTLASR